jgi:hypothetical protein
VRETLGTLALAALLTLFGFALAVVDDGGNPFVPITGPCRECRSCRAPGADRIRAGSTARRPVPSGPRTSETGRRQ